MQPSLVLDLNDLSEGLVFWELTIDAFQVFLVLLKDLNEAIHAKLFPPAACLQKCKATTQDVTHVATTADVRWQRTIRDRNQNRAGMVQNNEHLLDDLNGVLQLLYRYINLLGDLSPGLLNVVDLINVERARVRSKLHPDFLVDFDARL